MSKPGWPASTRLAGSGELGEDGAVSDTSKLTLLGAGTASHRYDSPDAAILEVFDNQHPATPWVVEFDCGEFTSLCPMTGQPDFGRVRVHYAPGQLCVESKSLKLYLGAYRNHGAFHEDCINRIADDIASRIDPRYLRVFGEFNVRGGIAISPLAVRTDPHLSDNERSRIVELLAQHDALRR
jgi:7-cyano-7-deazaguanine reductase